MASRRWASGSASSCRLPPHARSPCGASTFSIVSPLQNDARVAGMLASSAGNRDAWDAGDAVEHDVTLQIVQSMRMQFRDGIGEAVLKLKPEHLGSVSISLRVENGGLKANVQADMPAVQAVARVAAGHAAQRVSPSTASGSIASTSSPMASASRPTSDAPDEQPRKRQPQPFCAG